MQQCGVLMSTVAHPASQQEWHVGALEEAFVSLLRATMKKLSRCGIGLTHFNKLPLETGLSEFLCVRIHVSIYF